MQAPPFSSVTRVIFRGSNELQVQNTAQAVAEKLRAFRRGPTAEIRILGAAPAPITRLRGLWRFHLQVCGKTHELVRELWLMVEKDLTLPEGVEMAVDVDPINAR